MKYVPKQSVAGCVSLPMPFQDDLQDLNSFTSILLLMKLLEELFHTIQWQGYASQAPFWNSFCIFLLCRFFSDLVVDNEPSASKRE